MPPESDDDGLFLNRKDRRSRRLRPRRQIGNGSPRLPFGDGFRVDAIALGQRPPGSLGYAVSLGGPPLSLWRSHEEPVPWRILRITRKDCTIKMRDETACR